MISDRISLNIAKKYLNQFEQNQGTITNIQFARREHDKRYTKSATFGDLETLDAFIQKYTPLVTFKDSDCSMMGLYELKSFTLTRNNTQKNFIYKGTDGFESRSSNINKYLIQHLNNGYESMMREVRDAFDAILINEYILQQEEYIDCGYIEVHFEDAMEKLKELYNKYKQI